MGAADGARASLGASTGDLRSLGDVLIVSARTGEGLYPEVRVSAYWAHETDIWPSRLLKAGEQPYAIGYAAYQGPNAVLPWGDTAGSCVDPSDDIGIWVAHQYASGPTGDLDGNYDIWVGKFFAP